MKKIYSILLTLFITSILFSSCEIGLGAAVDAAAPDISINFPEKDGVVIMNDFTMSGYVSDDTGIKSVQVTFISTADKKISYGPYEAEVVTYNDRKNDDWSINLNKKTDNGKYEIPDGEYTVEVVATDLSSRTQTVSRVYKIDNTAPLVVIKRPGLDDTFGRTIRVTGDIGDENSLSALYFTAYEKSSEGDIRILGKTQKLSNISGVGLDIVVGKYYDNPVTEEEKNLHEVYMGFYGADKGTKDVFCTIEVADTAREYKPVESGVVVPSMGMYVPSQSEELFGNLSNEYYLYDEIYNTVYSDKGFKVSNADLVSIVNGTYSDTDVANSVNSFLSENKISTKVVEDVNNISKFTLNPSNYPSFYVSSLKYVNGFSELINENYINIVVSPGRDQIALKADTIRVVVDECNEKGELKYPNNKAEHEIVLVESQINIDKIEDEQKRLAAQEYRKSCLSISDNISVETTIGLLKTGKYYVVRVDGCDLDENPVESRDDELYGFLVVSNNKAPVITVTGGLDDLTIQNHSNFIYNGFVETACESVDLFYSVSAKNQNGSDYLSPAENIPISVNEDGFWSVEIPSSVVPPKANSHYLYTIVFNAIDSDQNKSVNIERRVHVDTIKPEVYINSVSPVITFEDDSENYVNGEITISGSVEDNEKLSNTRYKIYVYGDANNIGEPVKTGDFGESMSYGFKFDTKERAEYDKKYMKVVIQSTDRAGNDSEPQEQVVYIDQDTDLPVITLSNVITSVKDESGVTESVNLFQTSGNNKLLGNISDDDKVTSIVAKYKKFNTQGEYVKFYEKASLNTKAYSAEIPLQYNGVAIPEGTYMVQITVFGKTDSEVSSVEFCVGIDDKSPTIKLKSEDGGYQTSQVVVEGELSDSSGVITSFVPSLHLQGQNGATFTYTKVSEGNWNWKHTFAVTGNAGETITYIATDKYGRKSDISYTYKVDKSAPTVEITSPTESKGYVGSTLSTIKSFSGLAIDPNEEGVSNSSYIKDVRYSFDNSTDFDTWTSVSGVQSAVRTNWVANIDFGTVSGEKTVYFRARDNAGNVSEATSKDVIVDGTRPVISITVLQDGVAVEPVMNTYYTKGNTNVSINVLDENLDTVVSNAGSIIKVSEGKYSLNVSSTSDYVITATDKAGQVSTQTVSVYVDTKSPEIEITSVSPIVNIVDDSKDYVNGIISVKGTASDDESVKASSIKLYQTISGNRTDVTNIANCVTEVSNSKTRFEFTIDTTKLTDNIPLDITIESLDRAGNVGTKVQTVNVNQDTDKPVVSFSNVIVTNEAKDNLFGMGSNVLFCSVTDDDGIKSISYTINSKTYSVNMNGLTPTSKSFQFDVSQMNLVSGSYDLVVVATDKNNTVSNSYQTVIAYDIELPKLSITKLGEDAYTENMWVPSNFVIIGTGSDDNGIAGVYVSTDSQRANNLITQGINSPSVQWSFNASGLSDGVGSHKFFVVDIFGREYSSEITYQIDTVAPVFVNDVNNVKEDSSVKVIIESGNSKINTLALGNTWFAQKAVSISGSVTENNLDSLFLIVGDSESQFTAASSSGNKSMYKTTYTFEEGTSQFKLKAKDKAGNIVFIGPFVVNVDTTVPVVNSATVDGVSNGDCINKSTISVRLDVVDNSSFGTASGINEIVISDSLSFENKLKTWVRSSESESVPASLVIDSSSFNNKSYELFVRVVDKAGNKTEQKIVDFIYDSKVPIVKYTSPTQNSTVNKLLTIYGTVEDTNFDSSVANAKMYAKSGSAQYKPLSESVIFEGSNWSVTNIDTEAFTSSDTVFQLRLQDAAGNMINENNGAVLTLDINQDTDRPIVTLNTINTNGTTTLSSGEFSGTIEDDDGLVKAMYIQVVKNQSSLNDSAWGESVWGNESVSSKWTYNVTSSGGDSIDGNYNLFIKVVDSQNGVFITSLESSGNVLATPKVQYGSSAYVSTPIKFSIDSKSPTISQLQYSIDNGVTFSDLSLNTVFGGTKAPSVIFKVKAEDNVSPLESLTVGITFIDTEYKLSFNNDDLYFYSDLIQCTSFTGSTSVNVSAKDASPVPSTMNIPIIVDNEAPNSISNVKPNSSTEVTGSFTMTGLVNDELDGNSGVDLISYVIPKDSVTNVANVKNEDWINAAFNVTWSIDFTDLTTMLTDIESYDSYKQSSGVFYLPIWFKVIDKAGNLGYITNNILRYNPDADKPRVQITYPVHTQPEGNPTYVVMGSTVRFSGSAEDNEGIDSVWLQFDMNGDGVFENGLTNDKTATIQGCPYVVEEVKEILPGSGIYGVKANGTVSWSYPLKVSNLNNLSHDNGKYLNVRAVSVDNDTVGGQLYSVYSDVVRISVNNTVPVFENIKLKRFDSNGNPVAEQDYSSGMFIKGNDWYLTGEVGDSDGLESIVIEGSVESEGINSNYFTVANTTQAGIIDKYAMKIPIVGSGEWDVSITATDKSTEGGKPSTMNFVVNIDNVPPEFANKYETDQDIKKYGTIKLYSGVYGSSGIILNDQNYVQNSNGQNFTLAGRVTEADSGSGYKHLIFYYKRKANANDVGRVYNPMEAHGTDNRANRSDLVASKAVGKVYINEDTLPVLYLESVTRSIDSITSSALVGNKNVRKKGLVKIGGMYRLIETVDLTSGKITFSPACDESYTSAEFVYGMVIDHNGESTHSDGTLKNDDEDGMVETYIKNGTNYTWDASIDSSNIPDGPIEVHCVVFDNAGNSNHGYTITRVSNNRPRITSVLLGTDLNQNGKYEIDTEFTEFNAITKTVNGENIPDKSSGKEIWNLDTEAVVGSYWTIKKDLVVIPEFVGGTKDFYYVYSKSIGVGDTKNLKDPKTSASPTKLPESNANIVGSVSYNAGNSGGILVVPNNTLGTSTANGEDGENTYSFSFWDSTEETTPGTDSQWTILNAQMKQDIVDSTPPVVDIYKFYWESEEINSIYGAERNQKFDERKGHIDLPLLGDKSFNTEQNVSAKTETQRPAVSGIVEIKGSVYDETLLSELYIHIDNFTFTGATAGTGTLSSYYKVATFDTSSNTWEVVSSESDLTSNGWAIEVDGIPGQSGHSVEYKLIWNSDKITNHAKENVAINVVAKDKANVSDVVKYGNGIDVVPYIVKVETSLSSIKANNWSVYNRTAKGHYPVRSDETISLYGMNLTGATSTVGTFTKNTSKTSIYDVYDYVIGTTSNSRALNLSVNSVASRNNTHDYTPVYNQQPNNDNNNNLVDDIYLDVWEFDSDAVIPKSGKIEQPIMKINPVNDEVGFAFVNGPLYFSMGGSVGATHYSYRYWMGSYDFFTSVGFTYDTLGYSYGVAAGGDINSTSADKFQLMSSRWGLAGLGQSGSYDSTNSLRLESIGQKGDSAGNDTGTRYFDKQRIKSPSLVTTVNGDTTSLYLAYYDAMNDEIRFKSGSTNKTSKAGFGSFTDYDTAGDPYVYRREKVSMIAGSNTGRPAGEYVSIGAVKGAGTSGADVVVAVWYGSDRILHYSYNTSPMGRDGQNNAAGWSTPISVFSGTMANAGEYCKVVVDNDGGIHIAAYDSVNLDLCYAYLGSYNGTSFETCVVDSNGVTGSNLTIDVAKVDGKWIPYIGYYMLSCIKPKYAYKVDTSSVAPAGSVNDTFTQAWECMIVPTSSVIEMQSNQHNDINIAVWKNKDTGVIKNSKSGTNSHSVNNNGYSTDAYGHVYGNGTNNPIMGYAIKSGASKNTIETAQMR